MIEVLGLTTWQFGQTNMSVGGQMGQVTRCRYNKIVEFYTRENITGINSFIIGSGERWGDKVGSGKVRRERQVLELFAPKGVWVEIADFVTGINPLKRKVVENVNFNKSFISKLTFEKENII